MAIFIALILLDFYHQPFLTLILSQHLMVILGEFSYYDNFNDNSMINLTHRKGLFYFSFFGTSLINSYKSSRTKYDPSSHIFKQKIGTELFYNVLNPAHVPFLWTNSPTLWFMYKSRIWWADRFVIENHLRITTY